MLILSGNIAFWEALNSVLSPKRCSPLQGLQVTKNKFNTMTGLTITGRQIKVTPNHSKKTFTIRVNGSKYRTIKMSKGEFNEALYMTADDWQQYLNGCDDYYRVK